MLKYNMSIHKWVGRHLLIRPSEPLHKHALRYSSELHEVTLTRECRFLLHSSCFYVEASQLLCMQYYLCNCKLRRFDVISADTKLITTPFPKEYMLSVLYVVHDFSKRQSELKMNSCKCWGWKKSMFKILKQ